MKEHNKVESVTANILLAHGSKDPIWRTSFEILLEKIRKHSPKKNSISAIWNYVDQI
jgi:inhibitor of KinA sporulation pathway (predicted exonuclease)